MEEQSAQYELERAIQLTGPVTFREYMQRALYGVGGYYARNVRIGNDGADFYTASQSVLFAKTVARYVRRCWQEFGSPEHIQVVELGAGQGELALQVCLYLSGVLPLNTCVNYTIVDVSVRLRDVQKRRLEQLSDPRIHISWQEPLCDVPTVVVANEVLDAQPVEQLRKTAGGWEQAYVVCTDPGSFELVWLPAESSVAEVADAWLPIPNNTVAELAQGYLTLLSRCVNYGNPLIALFFDYGIVRSEWAEGVRPQGTVRAYRQHQVVNPLLEPGACDITADVYWDYAAQMAREAGFRVSAITTQGSFLMNAGILQLLEEETHTPAADPLRVAKLAGQFKQLVLPGGMGERFSVMECRK